MTPRAGGEDGDEVVFDLADWEPEQRASLDGILSGQGVPYRWEGAEASSSWMVPGPVSGPGSPPHAAQRLVVPERHGDLVEELIDELDHPDALEALDDDGDDAAPGVLSSLYVASDVLMGAPTNLAAAQELADALDAARRLGVPYGIDAGTWDELCRRAGLVAERLAEGGDEEAVSDAAADLRRVVRPLV